jgi:hypothetical protein
MELTRQANKLELAIAWLPWYPVWAILFVTLSVFTVWALTAHGRDIAMGYDTA